MNFPQTPNEERFYRQPLQGAIVQSAFWTLTDLNTGADVSALLGMPLNGPDYSMVLVFGLTDGVDYKLDVLLTTSDGQKPEGCAFIQCRECT